MNRLYLILVVVLICLILDSCRESHHQRHTEDDSHDSPSVSIKNIERSIPNYVSKVIKSYPSFNISYSDNKLVFEDGFTIFCND